MRATFMVEQASTEVYRMEAALVVLVVMGMLAVEVLHRRGISRRQSRIWR
jgi:Tfp pilus assembly protein PilX